MIITAVGDYLQLRRLPRDTAGLADIRAFIGAGDLRFANFEATVHREGECFGSQFSGGSYVRADPETLDDLRDMGFNALSTANNHSLDYAVRGAVETLRNLRGAGFLTAGTGENLDIAAAPAYVDTVAGRIALIAVTSTFDPSAMAGRQSRRVKGRPGVNGLRFSTEYRVTASEMAVLRSIADKTAINGYDDIIRAEGFLPPEEAGRFNFGGKLFIEADAASKTTRVNETDMRRVERAIDEALYQADYVVVSIHTHEVKARDKSRHAEFAEEFAHRCIDRGACAVLGHGPHELRPVELYKGRPIFYSLGNFVFHNENPAFAPEELFIQYGLTSDANLRDYFELRSDSDRRGLLSKPETFEAVMARLDFDKSGLTAAYVMPVELGFGLPRSRCGTPRPAPDPAATVKRLEALSAEYGVKFTEPDGAGVSCILI